MRLIDADAMIEKYPEIRSRSMKFNLDLAPTIDAVPVVRCKVCEYWDQSWECSNGNPGDHFCPMIGQVTGHDFYCKYGERMDGEDHDSC